MNLGNFNAAGTVRVRALAGFTATPGATFDVVAGGGTTSGGFAHVISEGLSAPRRFGVRVDPGRVRVTVLCGAADIAGAGADSNGDGRLDNNDFIVFISRFFNQDPSVDFGSAGGVQGADGLFNNNDFIAFIDLFFAGCP
ncbi:MAG: GC-type dockerin domain-anchored protein [Phycisphaerales bacterium]